MMPPGLNLLDDEDRWIWSGLTAGDGGDLDRDVPLASWHVPQDVCLKGDRLVWRWHDRDSLPVSAPAPSGVLQEFTALVTAKPDEILAFAKTWGALEICKHGLPATHNQPKVYPLQIRNEVSCTPVPVRADRCSTADWRWESLGKWVEVSHRARALLTVAAAVHDGEPSPMDLWFAAAWRQPTNFGSSSRFIAWADRYGLAAAVNGWLEIGGVDLEFAWTTEHPAINLRPRSLVGAVAVQLAFAVARTDGLRICSSCGAAYVPTRKPAANRRNYCKTCGIKAAQRDASRVYRQRKKGIGK